MKKSDNKKKDYSVLEFVIMKPVVILILLGILEFARSQDVFLEFKVSESIDQLATSEDLVSDECLSQLKLLKSSSAAWQKNSECCAKFYRSAVNIYRFGNLFQ